MNLFIENLRLAFSSLWANKSRAILTMLGIIIGIASVIAIMTVGNSLTLSVTSSMQTIGANNITVYVQQRETEAEERENGVVFGTNQIAKEATEDDYFTDEIIYDMIEEFPDAVEAISISEALGDGSVKKGTDVVDVSVSGVSRGYFVANELTMLEGETFTARDAMSGRNVALVSDEFCEDCFGEVSHGLLGQEIDVKLGSQTVSYTITGIYEYEQSGFGSTNQMVHIPLVAAKNISHSKNYATFTIVTKVGVDSDSMAEQVKRFLNGYYRSNAYFEVNAYSMSSIVSIMGNMMGTITTAVSVIAGIALLVGGIGVMNIMLVSVTERTREIGTRKALGASNGHIRTQFIIEAMIICLVGGMIGVVTGIGLGALGAHLLGYAASPSISSIIFSLLFSLAIGLFFGYYPANKAAKMNPIDALRYE